MATRCCQGLPNVAPCHDLLSCRDGRLCAACLTVCTQSEPVIRTPSKRPGLASPETSEVAGSRKCLQIQALLKAHWARRGHVGSVPGAGKEADTERGSCCYTSSLSPGPIRVPLVRIWDQVAVRNSPRSPLHEVPISQMATRNLARRSWFPSLASKPKSKIPKAGVGVVGEGGRGTQPRALEDFNPGGSSSSFRWPGT